MLNAGSGSPLVKGAVQSLSVTFGHLTSPARLLPGFLIVGAQRCGTTSLYRALSQHPLVCKPLWHKGIHYFDENYRRGLGWYRGHFPLRAYASWATRPSRGTPVTFESSPYYMFHPLGGERIVRDLPGVKLLVLVRDPVERAYSGHAHELARGYETEPFERALELEASRLAGEAERMVADPAYLSHSHQHHSYRARGRYIEQIERLERLAGRDRLHVVDSGAFWADPQPSLRRVLDFLQLPSCGTITFDRFNARSRAPMPDTVRKELREHFRPYDERLARWLGTELSWQT
jgi:Sulfotransferase domain